MLYCVAVNCKNGFGFGGSFHSFPRDSHLRKLWIQRVSRKDWTPGKQARLCSDHFEPDCFVRNPEICRQLKMNIILKKDAVPTIFPHRQNVPGKQRKRMAQIKRSNLEVRIINDCNDVTNVSNKEKL